MSIITSAHIRIVVLLTATCVLLTFAVQGQPFDPKLHEAVSRVDSADVPAGSVAVELQKGYKVGERLLRPAMVSVSTGPKPSA